MPNSKIKYHEYPKNLIKEVSITHDRFPKLQQLGLKWYAVPIISSMDLKLVASLILLRHLTVGIW